MKNVREKFCEKIFGLRFFLKFYDPWEYFMTASQDDEEEEFNAFKANPFRVIWSILLPILELDYVRSVPAHCCTKVRCLFGGGVDLDRH